MDSKPISSWADEVDNAAASAAVSELTAVAAAESAAPTVSAAPAAPNKLTTPMPTPANDNSCNRTRRARGGRGRGDKYKAAVAGSEPAPQKVPSKHVPQPSKPLFTKPAPAPAPAQTVSVYLYDGERRVSNVVLRQMNIPEYNGGSHLTLHDVRCADFDGVHAIVTGHRSVVCERSAKDVPPGCINITPGVLRYLARLDPDFTSDLTYWNRMQISRAVMMKLTPGCAAPSHGDGIDNDNAAKCIDVDILVFGWMYYSGDVVNA